MDDGLTPLQQQVLRLYATGTTSPTEIGQRLGFSRQRAQNIIRDLREKVLTETPSDLASTSELHPITSRDDPFPRRGHRARQGDFVIRGVLCNRSDGLDLSEGLPADECAIVITCVLMPREFGWSWAASLQRPWSLACTRGVYADWSTWLAYQQRRSADPTRWILPDLDGQLWCSAVELTRTIAWVIGVEALIYEPVAVPI